MTVPLRGLPRFSFIVTDHFGGVFLFQAIMKKPRTAVASCRKQASSQKGKKKRALSSSSQAKSSTPDGEVLC